MEINCFVNKLNLYSSLSVNHSDSEIYDCSENTLHPNGSGTEEKASVLENSVPMKRHGIEGRRKERDKPKACKRRS